MARQIEIQDVGPRDGLQSHANLVEAKDKIRLAASLYEAGIRRIELGSFVSPKAVPQMANVDEVFSQIGQTLPSHDAVEYMGLIVNRKGYDRAIAAGARAVTAVFACSDTLSQRNSRQSMSKASQYIVEVVEQARFAVAIDAQARARHLEHVLG